MQAETRKCQNCKADFTIEPNDFGFYEKIRVPPPTFCPDCRRQRRWAWRNNVSLYNRKCDLCGKSVISIYSPDSGLVIYCNKCWWSDKWDPKSYAMDCDNIRSANEWLYECMVMNTCYGVKNSYWCKACIDSQFLYDCTDCSNCFMSAGLRGKKYNFKNKQYSKEDYEKILEDYHLDTWSGTERAKKEFDNFILKYPRRFVFIYQSLNCIGDIISASKNLKYCFQGRRSENCSYCDFISGDKDSYDMTMSGELSECYECFVADHSQLNRFGIFSVKSQDIQYTQHCHNCKHSFGCVGLRNTNYAIFNKQYSKEEYQKLVPKIIEHMNQMPYKDKAGNIYK